MFNKKTEFAVGLFMVAGIFLLVYLSVTLGKVEIFSSRYYTAIAAFDSITGLKEGASVEIAGVQVGKVKNIILEDDMAMVELSILTDVSITDDIIASVRTKGVIGDKYVKLSPGGSDEYIEDGGIIMETESAISLEELVSKYMFEKE